MYQQLLHCLLRLVFCAQSEKRLRRLHFEQAYKEHIRASFTAEVLQLIKSHSPYTVLIQMPFYVVVKLNWSCIDSQNK